MSKSSQSVKLPYMEHLTVLIPSTSQPSWGGYSIFDLKEVNCSIHELTIKLNISAITGLEGEDPNYPNYNPSFFFLQRVEIVINNSIIDTIYPEEQWLRQQLFEYDEKRKYLNLLCGDYSNPAQRSNLANAQNDYYIPLWSFFKQTHLNLFTTAHNVQLRCYWNTAANNINVGTLEGTPSSTINSGVLLVKLTRYQQNTVSKLLPQYNIKSKPYTTKFTELRYGTFVVNGGTASTNIVLTPIVGPVAFLIFIVRNSANLKGENYWNFLPVKDWSILDASSTNITGGVQISHAEALLLLNKDNTLSSYSTENSLSTNDNNANVYIYAFSGNVTDIIHSGRSLGYHYFRGNEQILINFNEQLTANVQVDVYAYCDAGIEQTLQSIKKISIL